MFDAAAPSPKRARDVLLRLQDTDADQRLMSLFDEIDEMIEEGRERDREQGLDPGISDLLDAISGADDAPMEFRSLHRRVQAGTLSWLAFWLAPEEEAGGHRLVNEAMKVAGAELGEILERFDEENPPKNFGVLGR